MVGAQTVVRHVPTGKIGVVIQEPFEPFGSCDPEQEAPVVFDGTTSWCAVSLTELEKIGPEQAIADWEKCGAGNGRECCMFLAGSPTGGLKCQRFGPLRWVILFTPMGAKRHPRALYTACQLS